MILVLTAIVILAIGVGFGGLKTSEVNDFPVPLYAKVEEFHSEQSISYRYRGMNRLYLQQITLRGWKEIDQMGGLKTFEKNGEKVDIITFQGGFQIIGHDED
ncbi:hypothetical protein CR194_04380 [Salipaludibacillus keqinensis]|uniref:Uncharacterized protein n=1 Tax=Salipaludibacillus keqinensis TaxID=2045207 RepID=A0A323TKI4_9BACI|nr:hypothetical protein CR194_04380 [Salipaludibacillus keqinensis]